MPYQPLSESFVRRLEKADPDLHLSAFTDPPLSTLPNPADPFSAAPSAALDPPDLFLSAVTPQPLRWLWPGRIPLGKLTLLDAAPGCGASLLALSLAASLSRGSPLPDGSPGTPGTVILIAPHDHPADTLLPRLLAAGGDPDRVLLLSRVPDAPASPTAPPRTRPFSLARDLDLLRRTIIRVQATCVILDPLCALHSARASLLPLAQVAQETGCAILLTRSLPHLPAQPFSAPGTLPPVLTLVRSRLLLLPHPADERQWLLLTVKASLCAPPPALCCQLTTTAEGTPFLTWLGPLPDTLLWRLPTYPARSPQRQAILSFVRAQSGPVTYQAILEGTSYDEEAGRKMLERMRQARELISPAPRLYTTPDHPCLASTSPAITPAPHPTPIAHPSVSNDFPPPASPTPPSQNAPTLQTPLPDPPSRPASAPDTAPFDIPLSQLSHVPNYPLTQTTPDPGLPLTEPPSFPP